MKLELTDGRGTTKKLKITADNVSDGVSLGLLWSELQKFGIYADINSPGNEFPLAKHSIEIQLTGQLG